jgi:hypothetical protein
MNISLDIPPYSTLRDIRRFGGKLAYALNMKMEMWSASETLVGSERTGQRYKSRDSLVGVIAGYALDDWGSIPGRDSVRLAHTGS